MRMRVLSPESSKVRGIYRHFKRGDLYKVLGIGLDTDTDTKKVYYIPLYACHWDFFSRDPKVFFGDVEQNGKMVKRYERIAIEESELEVQPS